jgi:hypothetical protein
MKAGMQKRLDDIDAQLEQFPIALKPSPEKRAAIENGKVIMDAAVKEDLASQPSSMKAMTNPSDWSNDNVSTSRTPS